MKKVGHWAFIAGIVIAVIAGVAGQQYLGTYSTYVNILLVLLGLVVGYLNIQQKEMQTFLIATIALMLVRSAGFETIPQIGSYLKDILLYITIFVAPAALIVALKAVYELGKS